MASGSLIGRPETGAKPGLEPGAAAELLEQDLQPALQRTGADSKLSRDRLVLHSARQLRIDKATDTAALRAALHQLVELPQARTLTSGPFAGVDKIWLDRPIQAALHESAAQIGAPTAWQQGYDGTGVTVAVLDSGIDAEHPDLAGRVVAASNFSSSDTTDDRHGHGTHVASTVAGSGAASDGRYTGVAPGAGLITAGAR